MEKKTGVPHHCDPGRQQYTQRAGTDVAGPEGKPLPMGEWTLAEENETHIEGKNEKDIPVKEAAVLTAAVHRRTGQRRRNREPSAAGESRSSRRKSIGGTPLKIQNTHPHYTSEKERMERLRDLKKICAALLNAEPPRDEKRPR